MIRSVPTHFITQEMYQKVIAVEPGLLSLIPEQFNTQGICKLLYDNFCCTIASVPKSF